MTYNSIAITQDQTVSSLHQIVLLLYQIQIEFVRFFMTRALFYEKMWMFKKIWEDKSNFLIEAMIEILSEKLFLSHSKISFSTRQLNPFATMGIVNDPLC